LAISIAFVSLILTTTALSQQKVYTVAGGFVGDGRPATEGSLANPQFAAFDTRGNLYVSDTGNNRIREINSAGEISTVVGSALCGFAGDGGPATKAEICGPFGLAFDKSGNLYFSDYSNSRIRMVSRTGTITTVAGNGTFGFCGDGGPATQACLNGPQQVAVVSGRLGELLEIADYYNCRIRQVSIVTGTIETVAGNGTCAYGGDGGPATSASLDDPVGVAFYEPTHTLWISEYSSSVIRTVDTQTGIINLTYGNPNSYCDGGTDLCFPGGISLDNGGNLYVADTGGDRVLEVSGGTGTDIAGVDLQQGFNGDGIAATSALMTVPASVALDTSGNLYTVDSGNARIRKGMGSGNISTIAGGYIGDGGSSQAASINASIFQNNALDSHGNLYIADPQNHRIRKVTRNGTISTFAGTGFSGYSGDGEPATQAELNFPEGVAIDRGGDVYISDTYNLAIRKVDSTGNISTFVSEIFLPTGMTVDSAGNLYVADFAFCTVWKITPDGIPTIVAGVQFECGYNSDGIPATQALLYFPTAVAVDRAGLLYIADFQNSRVRVVNTQGIINTEAGNGTCGFSGDGGPAGNSVLCFPLGVAVDAKSNLYIADFENGRIREVSAGVISTFAGSGDYGYNGNGLPALQSNMSPGSLLSSGNDVFFWDYASYRVRVVH
jgi:sugar lactone lactonase YvrE